MGLFDGILELPLLGGVIFMIMAGIMHLFPPRKINDLYGYRTSTSKKSQAHWDFAQQYSIKVMALCGFVMVLISLFGLVFTISASVRLGIGIVLMLGVCAVLLITTETALRRKFPNN